MAWKDWLARRTPLQPALRRGTEPGGDLADDLNRLDDYPIRSQADAEAGCDVRPIEV